jgi:hypothetical protein
MTTDIIIWDDNHRELSRVQVTTTGPRDARREVQRLIGLTRRGDYAYYNIPDWPNQNDRSGWTLARD